jgi:hypothetical protein
MIGTIGYSGNATSLQTRKLPPHLHFAYIRAAAGTVDGSAATLATIKDSAEGLNADFAQDSILAGVSGVLHPAWAVRFLKCWDDPSPAVAPSSPGRTVGRQPRE